MARVVGRGEVHWFALEPHFARIGDHGARERLDQRRLARAIIADDGEDLARVEVEVAMIESDDLAVALHEVAAREDGLSLLSDAHADTFLIHWSTATAAMISTPMKK